MDNLLKAITYKVIAHNPNPEMVSDSMWQELIKQQFGERGFMTQKYFYKEGNYCSEIDAGLQSGLQAFNPEDGLLYSWAKDSEEAVTVDTKKCLDAFVEIVETTELDTILAIPCKSLLIKSKLGTMTLWYNSDYLKVDPNYYEGHLYGHWEQILKKTGCLPLKVEQSGFMSKMTQIAIEYKEEKVKETKFAIPEFKEVTANPMN